MFISLKLNLNRVALGNAQHGLLIFAEHYFFFFCPHLRWLSMIAVNIEYLVLAINKRRTNHFLKPNYLQTNRSRSPKFAPIAKNPTRYANQIGYRLTPLQAELNPMQEATGFAKANRYGANQKSAIGREGRTRQGGGKVIDHLIRHALKQVVPPHPTLVHHRWSSYQVGHCSSQSHREILLSLS